MSYDDVESKDHLFDGVVSENKATLRSVASGHLIWSHRGNLAPGIKTHLPSRDYDDKNASRSISKSSDCAYNESQSNTSGDKTCIQDNLFISSDKSKIIDNTEMLTVVKWMPETQRWNEFHCSYDLSIHGASLETMYSFCCSPGTCGTLIIMEDSGGHVFGGYINQSIAVSHKYYGNGQSFVFSLRPEVAIYRWQRKNKSNTEVSNNGININDSDTGMFILSSYDKLLMGGGGGFAFQVDDEFKDGISQTCETYNNKILSQTELFSCVNVEVWTATSAAASRLQALAISSTNPHHSAGCTESGTSLRRCGNTSINTLFEHDFETERSCCAEGSLCSTVNFNNQDGSSQQKVDELIHARDDEHPHTRR